MLLLTSNFHCKVCNEGAHSQHLTLVRAGTSWVEQAHSCVAAGAIYILFKPDIVSLPGKTAKLQLLEHLQRALPHLGDQGNDQGLLTSASMLQFGICSPPPRACSSSDDVGLGWHYLIHHFLDAPEVVCIDMGFYFSMHVLASGFHSMLYGRSKLCDNFLGLHIDPC